MTGGATYACCGAPAVPPFLHKCKGGAAPVGCTTKHRAQAAEPVRRPPLGRAAEDALCVALEAAGYGNIADLPCGFGIDTDRVFVRQYAWALDAGRDYRADFAWPAIKVMCEVVGGAHAAGRSRVKKDVERDGLAASLGWLVVKVTPEQVRDGSAVELITSAIGARE